MYFRFHFAFLMFEFFGNGDELLFAELFLAQQISDHSIGFSELDVLCLKDIDSFVEFIDLQLNIGVLF
jgi:hypothetical protein